MKIQISAIQHFQSSDSDLHNLECRFRKSANQNADLCNQNAGINICRRINLKRQKRLDASKICIWFWHLNFRTGALAEVRVVSEPEFVLSAELEFWRLYQNLNLHLTLVTSTLPLFYFS